MNLFHNINSEWIVCFSELDPYSMERRYSPLSLGSSWWGQKRCYMEQKVCFYFLTAALLEPCEKKKKSELMPEHSAFSWSHLSKYFQDPMKIMKHERPMKPFPDKSTSIALFLSVQQFGLFKVYVLVFNLMLFRFF